MLWLAGATLVVLGAAYILRPLFGQAEGIPDLDLGAETRRDLLLHRKAALDRILGDLEFEYKMGRLSQSDYGQIETEYKADAAAVSRGLNGLDASENPDPALEAEIAARKAELFGSGRKPAPEEAPASETPPVQPARCPFCGAEVIPGKKYCPDCGRRLK